MTLGHRVSMKLRLQLVDQDGNIITTIPLPTYVLRPALQSTINYFALNAPQHIETGDECTISRIFPMKLDQGMVRLG